MLVWVWCKWSSCWGRPGWSLTCWGRLHVSMCQAHHTHIACQNHSRPAWLVGLWQALSRKTVSIAGKCGRWWVRPRLGSSALTYKFCCHTNADELLCSGVLLEVFTSWILSSNADELLCSAMLLEVFTSWIFSSNAEWAMLLEVFTSWILSSNAE